MKHMIATGLLLLIFPIAASPQEAKKDVRATIQDVDAEVGTITVILSEMGKVLADRVRTLNLAKPDIPVVDSAGKARKVKDLAEDDRVVLSLVNDEVQAVQIAPPAIYGTLKKVDGPSRTLTLTTKIGERVMQAPAAVRVYGFGMELTLDDLKPGMTALVSFAPDQKTVTEVRTGKTAVPYLRLSKSTGYVIEVDRDRSAALVFVNFHNGDSSFLREYPIMKDASFGLLWKGKHFRDVGIEALARGTRSDFWVDLNTMKIAHMGIEMPTLGKREVKKVDAAARQLTIEDPTGDVQLKLAPHVQILKAGKPATIDDIRPAIEVNCALSPDRKSVEAINILSR